MQTNNQSGWTINFNKRQLNRCVNIISVFHSLSLYRLIVNACQVKRPISFFAREMATQSAISLHFNPITINLRPLIYWNSTGCFSSHFAILFKDLFLTASNIRSLAILTIQQPFIRSLFLQMKRFDAAAATMCWVVCCCSACWGWLDSQCLGINEPNIYDMLSTKNLNSARLFCLPMPMYGKAAGRFMFIFLAFCTDSNKYTNYYRTAKEHTKSHFQCEWCMASKCKIIGATLRCALSGHFPNPCWMVLKVFRIKFS